jgi:V8-like Glu-specific endopeptidase
MEVKSDRGEAIHRVRSYRDTMRVGRLLLPPVPTALMALALAGCAPDDGAEAVGARRARIIGGHVATPAELMATVALVRADDAFCSGTLVAPRLVVTAAHCVTQRDRATGAFTEPYAASEVGVAAGVDGVIGEAARVAQVIAADFDGDARADAGDNPEGLGRAHDIALLVLESPFGAVAPAEVLPADALLASGDALVIAGYGVTAPGRQDRGRLRVGATRLVRRSATELYAAADDADACAGDSGGPAYRYDEDAGVAQLVGVSSRGAADAAAMCGDGGIWTIAPAYEPWLREAAAGAYPEPVAAPAPPAGCAIAPTTGPSRLLVFVVAALATLARRRSPRINSPGGWGA